MTSPGFSLHGAVDLSGLGSRRTSPPPASPAGGTPAGGMAAGATTAVDVTEATFQAEVLDRSGSVPVIVDFWAEWCEPCKHLSPALERLAAADAGRWVLAKVDVDANQRLAAAAGVQSIPSVKAIVGGKLVHEFTGALPENEVRRWLDAILQYAAQQGIGDGEVAVPPADPDLEAALDAIDAGDLDMAAAAYRRMLDRAPGDPAAVAGLAQVELVRHGATLEPAKVRQAAAERPDDVQAQCDAADLDLLGGHVEDAFGRLVDVVRRTSGTERDRARTHLLGLFDAVGGDDPRVLSARRALASALF